MPQFVDREDELDVLGLTDEGPVAGECKFTSSAVGDGELADLERTTAQVRWSEEPAESHTRYVLFSRSGFTDDLRATARERADLFLYGLEDVLEPAR